MEETTQTVLVTGGLGFIGSHLVDRLVDEGHRVVVVDIAAPKGRSANKAVTYVKADIWYDEKKIRKMFEKYRPDVVFHLAAHKDLRGSLKGPIRHPQVNFIGTLNLLESMRDNGGGRFIFSSTAAIYSPEAKLPIKEAGPIRPEAPYGISKRTAELYLWHFSEMHQMACMSLRFSNVYGPRSRGTINSVVNVFVDRLMKGETPYITGSGEQTRDFLYVDDVVDAFMRSMKVAWCGEMNISTGEEVSLNKVYGLIQEELGTDIEPDYVDAASGELFQNSLDASLAYDVMGWKARTSIEEGIKKVIDWEREHGEHSK